MPSHWPSTLEKRRRSKPGCEPAECCQRGSSVAPLPSPTLRLQQDYVDFGKRCSMNRFVSPHVQAQIQREGTVVVRISQESLAAYYNEHPEAKREK